MSEVTVPPACGVRLHWPDLPVSVRAGVEAFLGDRVVCASSQPGGFSPGVAARLRLAGGRRAFVKAAGASTNVVAPQMHRAEARIAALLPATAPVPRLLGVHDDGEWVAVAYEDVEGRQPELPWELPELERVLAATARLHAALTPAPGDGFPAAATQPDLLSMMASWRKLLHEQPVALDDWSRRHLEQLVELEQPWSDVVVGDTLLHLDLRADNMLVRPDGSVVFVDWPAAAVGASFVDVVLLAPSVAMQGGPDLDWILARHPGAAEAAPEAVLVVLAAIAGYFTHGALQPPPPGLPTLRAFQGAQARVARAWLAERLGA